MKVSVVGTGYVGTTLAACLADVGHRVVLVDIDAAVIDRINAGDSPVHEPELETLVAEHGGARMVGTTAFDRAGQTDMTFLALPTPSDSDGRTDTTALEAGTRSLGRALAASPERHLVVIKSAVPPRTTEETLIPLLDAATEGRVDVDYDIAVNPAFLQRGTAVEDVRDPDRVVLGTRTARAASQLKRLYRPLWTDRPDLAERVRVSDGGRTTRFVETDLRTAELIKHANDAFLATKRSLANELGNICKEYGIDAHEVTHALGRDHRIGSRYLATGLGWKDAQLSKNTASLIASARAVGYEPNLLEMAVAINERQPRRLLALLDTHVDVETKPVAVLGLATKAGTDIIDGSRSLPVIEGLIERGAEVAAYDPVAIEAMRDQHPELTVRYVDSAAAALEDAVAAIVTTAWDEFATLDREFDRMRTPLVLDGRGIVERRDGITYEGLTWSASHS